MNKKIGSCLGLLALFSFLFLPLSLFASETRVDSAGGITSVMDDETNNGDMFLDGNPAGLILLKTHDRLDLAGQWTYSSSLPVTAGSYQQTFSTIPRLTNDSVIKYEGLMLFPDPHWAVQLAGDFLYPQGQNVYYYDTYSTQQFRSLVRAAYDAGPVALGLEVSDNEIDNSYDPGLFSTTVGLASGSSQDNKCHVRGGIITTFPDGQDKDSPNWQIGGVFETQLGYDVLNLNTQRFYYNSPAFNLQQQTSTTDYYYFGPEVRYEIPGRLLVRFSSFVTNDYTHFLQTASQAVTEFPDLGPYVSSQYQNMTNLGLFRLTLPLSDKTNLKLGGSLTAYLYNIDLIGKNANVYNNQNRQQVNGTFGIGLESPGDYNLGLQFIGQSYISEVQLVADNSTTATDYNYYHLALGGEKKVGSNWALRGGLVMEDDIYTVSKDLNTLYLDLTSGLGYEDKNLRLDAKGVLGEGVNVNNSGSNSLQTEAELQGTFFL